MFIYSDLVIFSARNLNKVSVYPRCLLHVFFTSFCSGAIVFGNKLDRDEFDSSHSRKLLSLNWCSNSKNITKAVIISTCVTSIFARRQATHWTPILLICIVEAGCKIKHLWRYFQSPRTNKQIPFLRPAVYVCALLHIRITRKMRMLCILALLYSSL